MLLRSSSTPLLGSLLPPDHHHDAVGKHSPSSFAFHCNNGLSHRASAAFPRTYSEGNLNTLPRASDAVDVFDDSFSFDSFCSKPNKLCHRPTRSVLQSIPSFSFYGSGGGATEEEEDDDEDEDEGYQRTNPEEDEGCFGIENRMEAAIVAPEVRALEEAWTRVGSGDGIGFVGEDNEMYLARGLGIGIGIGGADGGGGRRRRWRSGGGGGGEQQGMEEYYRKMVVENPGNALVLSNYAEFLYQWKGDLGGAEEYYSRAILMDSKDGEILSKYAKLVWELHHDQQKASSYFQRAIQASPHDSHVQAAYANFLWETEEEEDDEEHGLVKEMATQTYTAAATA